MPNPIDTLLPRMSARTGHFALESGHHGALWLELDALFWEPAALEPLAHLVEAAGLADAHGIIGTCAHDPVRAVRELHTLLAPPALHEVAARTDTAD